MGKTRRLNAILFADIAGYTSIMQHDESNAQRIIAKFRAATQEHVKANSGRIVNYMGDGCLCVFDSSVNASECALALQEEFLKEPKVPVRIGIHSGDVYFENESVFGNSVNVASRIESIGVPGSVLFSERVYNDIRNQPLFKTSFLSEISFKNVNRPIKIYGLSNPGLSLPDVSNLEGKISSKKNVQSLRNKIVMAAIAIVLFVVAGLLFRNYNLKQSNVGVDTDLLTVAVLGFENKTGDAEFDILSEISSDRFINGISQLDIARVISGKTIDEYENILLASTTPASSLAAMAENFGVNRVIEGQIYKEGKDLLMECTISDPQTNEIILATPSVRCTTENPMQGIEEMRQHILSALIVEEDRDLNLLLETTPPKYEAYKTLLAAKKTEEDEDMLVLLNKAIAIDSNYFEPKVLRISCYYNLEEFEVADSLTKVLESEMLEDPRQKNLLNFYKALMAGQNNLIYHHFNEELKLAPFDMMSNNTVLVLATEFINDVDKAFEIYDIIDERLLDFKNCDDCRTRIYVKMYMDLEKGDLKNAMRLGEILASNGDKVLIEKLRLRAWVRAGQWDDLSSYIEDEQLIGGTDRASLYLFTAKECSLADQTEKFNWYSQQALAEINTTDRVFRKGEIYLLNEDYGSAVQAFDEYLKTIDPNDIQTMCMLAASQYLNRQTDQFESIIQKVNTVEEEYQFGDVDYFIATAYAIIGQKEEALKHIRSSIVKGRRVGYYGYHNDHWLSTIHDESKFEEALSYWANLGL